MTAARFGELSQTLFRFAAAWVIVTPAVVAVADQPSTSRVPTQAYWTPVDRSGFIGPSASGTGLLDYDLAADPDAPFNRAATGLVGRVSNAALQANPHAKADQGRIMNVSAFGPTSNTAAQGGFGNSSYYAFGHWQYIDTLTFFGGSAGEGNILAPRAGLVDAAHRNGVKVYGNLFFAPTVFGGEISRVDDLLTQRPDGTFPVADKLIQVAQTQGFDGYFINQETEPNYNTESATARRARAAKVSDLMAYVQRVSNVELSWYDSFTESGDVGYRERLDTQNDAFFHKGTQKVAQSMFLDYGATASGLAASKTLANSYGRSVYDLHVGVDFEPAKYDSTSFGGVKQAVDAAFGDANANVNHNGSLALFRADQTAGTPEEFWAREQLTWSGARQNPADTSQTVGSQGWRGAAHYVAEKSPLVFDTFVSDFNLGIGKKYYVDGKLNRNESWNDIGLQDVLPTWRFWVESAGTKLKADLDFNDAYNGGSSLRVSGNLSATNDLNLYLANIDVSGDSKLQLAFKTGRAGATSMMALVRFKGDEANPVAIPVGSTVDGNWTLRDLDLSAYAGRTIAGISLRFGGSTDASYAINIGRVGIIRGQADKPAAATNGRLQQASFSDSVLTLNPTVADARVLWDHSVDYARVAGNKVYGYQVFQRDANGEPRLLGGGGSNARYLGSVQRINGEERTLLEVVTIGREFGRSTPATVEFWWPVLGNRVRNFDVEMPAPASTARPNTWRGDRLDTTLGDNSGTETSGTYAAWSTTRFRSGNHSLMLAADGGPDGTPAWTTAVTTLTGGQTYTARWWWALDLSAGRIDVLLRYLAADNTTVLGQETLSFAGSNTPGLDLFLRQEAILRVPVGATGFDISFLLAPGAVGVAYIDDISLGQPVPEPAALTIAAVGTLALLRRIRRRGAMMVR